MKLTPWFPGSVKPVRRGVYERQYVLDLGRTVCSCYAKWDGSRWYFRNRTVAGAASEVFSSGVLLPWRGLAQDPKKARTK